ncbi:uncharacterized protein [Panulirus ornatus]|uniref:uncharacterized protein n=1 Tax=Panulirus ornatus TaxID=150431 RepID=UPI003A86DC2B
MMSGSRGVAWAVMLMVVIVHCTPSHAHFGSCEDHTPECLQWALAGWCQNNRQYMLQNCPVSCNLCLDPDCFDVSPYCDYYVRRGGCRRSDVLASCPHSCDSCSIGPSPLGSPVLPTLS